MEKENKNLAEQNIPEVDITIDNWWGCVTDLKQKGETLEITYDKGRLKGEKSNPKTIFPTIHEPTEENEFARVKLKLKRRKIFYNVNEEIPFRVIRNDEELNKLGELFDESKLGNEGCSHTIFLTEVRRGIFGDTDEETGKVTIPRVDFSYCYFDTADFSNSIFDGEANFSHSTFNEAGFSSSIFNDKANFYGSTFNDTADFWHSTFNNIVSFWRSTFNNKAEFWYSTFNNEADFESSTFNEANFYGSTFKAIANFNYLKKCESIAFNNATINFLDIKSSSLPLLSLKGAQIEKIDFTGTVIESSTNRETFTILKNIALKQNDQISALKFYKKEMNAYYEKLTREEEKTGKKREKNSSEKFILWVEKWVSNYGTSWVWALMWILGFNILIVVLGWSPDIPYIVESDYSWLFKKVMLFFESLNLFSRVELASEPVWNGAINFFRLAGNAFLYYELVKSLRMFSRKL